MTSKIMFTRKELNLVAKERGIKKPGNMSTEELLDALIKYDSKCEVEKNRKKLEKNGVEKIAELQNISKNNLSRVKKLQNKSIDELHEIARLRGLGKRRLKLTKEDLIFSLLRSEGPAEHSYMKYFSNSTSDDKIKSKINDIRLIISRLGNIVTEI